jgi:hypothetical protein
MSETVNAYASIREKRDAINRLIREEIKPRTVFTISTPPLEPNASANVYIVDAYGTYGILNAQTNSAAWVSMYIDSNSMIRDAGRSIDSDPFSNAGVVLEFITDKADAIPISPIINGYTTTGETLIPVRVTNTGNSNISIELTFTLLKI